MDKTCTKTLVSLVSIQFWDKKALKTCFFWGSNMVKPLQFIETNQQILTARRVDSVAEAPDRPRTLRGVGVAWNIRIWCVYDM